MAAAEPAAEQIQEPSAETTESAWLEESEDKSDAN